MDDTLWYLHPSAHSSAEWLCDADGVTQLIESAQVLSTAIRKATLIDSAGFYSQLIDHPWIEWTSASAYHTQWVFDYYITLCNRFRKIESRPHAAERIRFNLEKFIDIFPMLPFTPPCDDAEMRDAYKAKVRIKDYHSVKRPFFIKRG